MNWRKKNWLWLVINIIAILPLLGILAYFKVEFTSDGRPNIIIEQPSFDGRREFEGAKFEEPLEEEGYRDAERSPLSLPLRTTGEWAIRWLVFSLTCTPLYILFGWRNVLTIKKALGLWAFIYASLHLFFFVADRGWLSIFSEFNFILGLLSLLIMVILALTSNRRSMNMLSKNWKLMHRAAYAAGILAVLHVVFLGKGDWLIYAVLLILGFVVRIPRIRKTVVGFRQRLSRRDPIPA